jgi:ferritin-like metal-binding protein YciE
MRLDTLKDLYVEQLQNLYSVEVQLLDALPKMAQAATSTALRQQLTEHLEQTREHRQRLEQIFRGLGADPQGHPCEGARGILKEGEELLRIEGRAEVIDAGLIAAAQRLEHYEIAGYGTVSVLAEKLGRADDKKLLGQTLAEEKQADEALTAIALKLEDRAVDQQRPG